MFGRKTQSDVKKSAAKVLDSKKDTVTRLKHLKIIIELYDINESKLFFEQFYSQIYYLFYDGFTNVETSLSQKVNKAHREELDCMLFIFEKILLFLPEMIHKRWQIQSIYQTMKKLLYSGNSLKLRREGIRLFIIWYQILMENSTDKCHYMFNSLVWGGKLPSPGKRLYSDVSSSDTPTLLSSRDAFDTKMFNNSKINVVDAATLLPPQPGDKTPDNLTKYFLDVLLHYMVSEVNKIEWTNKELRCYGFNFLFDRFKRFYFVQFFPDFDFRTDVYSPTFDLPDKREIQLSTTASTYSQQLQTSTYNPETILLVSAPSSLTTMLMCQESIIIWFCLYTNVSPRNKIKAALLSASSSSSVGKMETLLPVEFNRQQIKDYQFHSSSSFIQNHKSQPPSVNNNNDNEINIFPSSNTSTLSTNSSLVDIDKNLVDNGECLEGNDDVKGIFVSGSWLAEMVRLVLYATRENVNIVHEVFKQAFLQYHYESYNATRRVINVFKNWYQVIANQSNIPTIFQESKTLTNSIDLLTGGIHNKLFASTTTPDVSVPPDDVKVGLQNSLRFFFTISSNVFMVSFSPSPVVDNNEVVRQLDSQVDMCKRVLNLYRYSVMNLYMDKTTWEQLLMVLLKITKVVMSQDCQANTLACRLSEPLFKTLIVTWIKANLNTNICSSLWQSLIDVLSSLTHCLELIKEWMKAMDMLTRVLSKHVYNLDFNDLPLDKMSEQKTKKIKGGLKNEEQSKENVSIMKKLDTYCQPLNPITRLRSFSGDLSPQHSCKESTAKNHSLNFGKPINKNDLSMSKSLPLVPSADHKSAVKDQNLIRSCSDNSLLIANVNFCDQNVAEETSQTFQIPTPDFVRSKKCFEEHASKLNVVYHPNNDSTNLSTMTLTRFDLSPAKCATLDPTLLAHNLSSSLSTHDSVSISSSDLSSLPFITIPYEQTNNRLVEQTNVDSFDQRNFNNFINNNISVSVDSVDEDKFDSFLIENDPNKRELIDEEDDDDDEDNANDYNDVGDVQPDYRKSSESLKQKHSELCLNVINHSENTNVTVDHDKISPINLISSIASLSRNVTIPNLQSNSTLKSVLYNGNITGWNVDLAVLLWKRLLGSLGNVNDIIIPSLHLVVIEFFSNLTDWLTKIRDNQSVTTDNQSTPDPPLYIPPINHIIPWLYQALNLPDTFHASKLVATMLLCKIALRKHVVDYDLDHLVRFYWFLHLGLTSPKVDVCNNLMKHCTSRFLSTAYPGSSLLVLDFVHTIDKVLSYNTLNKEADQCCSQALAFLGSLQIFVNRFKCVLPVFDPSRDSLTITLLPNIKEKMLFMLMSAARKEPFGKSKCTALSSLGIYLYKELNSKKIDEHISEIFDIFLSALQVSDRITNQTASELITLLSDHSHLLVANVPNLVYRIIQDMTKTCCSLLPHIRDATIHPGSKHSASKTVKELIFVIFEWCMKSPILMLTSTSIKSGEDCMTSFISGHCLLHEVFQVLSDIQSGSNECSLKKQQISIQQQNLKHQRYSDTSFANTPDESSYHAEQRFSINISDQTSSLSPITTPSLTSASIATNCETSLKSSRHSVVGLFDSNEAVTKPSKLELFVNDVNEENNFDPITRHVVFAANMALRKLLNYIGYFPFSGSSVSHLGSSMQENQLFKSQQNSHSEYENIKIINDKKWNEVIQNDTIQFFVLNTNSMLSVVEAPSFDSKKSIEEHQVDSIKQSTSFCNFLLRDISGQFSWNVATFHPRVSYAISSINIGKCDTCFASIEQSTFINSTSNVISGQTFIFSPYFLSLFSPPLPTSSSSSMFATTKFFFTDTPNNFTAKNEDFLDSTLNYIGKTSPECLQRQGFQLNVPFTTPHQLLHAEDVLSQAIQQQYETITMFSINGHLEISDEVLGIQLQNRQHKSQQQLKTEEKNCFVDLATNQFIRQFLFQLGFFQWKKRKMIDLLKKNEKLVRELKHLDNQKCRETHKIALIYVGLNQEDKLSILSNKQGSPAYEAFLQALGWKVDLKSHMGFSGGLQANGSNGAFAPYNASSNNEIIFHVATMMPGDGEEEQLRKLRHLGNDEVHIIWSEHIREYRHGIIPTEFGDVLLIIYPLECGLYRVQIKQKSKNYYFGPLYDETVVDSFKLPGLIKHTAVNASRSLHSQENFYEPYYECRWRALKKIFCDYKKKMTFEEFSSHIVLPRSIFKEMRKEQDLHTTPIDQALPNIALFKAGKGDVSSTFQSRPSIGKNKKVLNKKQMAFNI